MSQVQVMDLEVDSAGIVVRALYHEGSPWSAGRFVGLPLREVIKTDDESKALSRAGLLADGTICQYRACELNGFRTFKVIAEIPQGRALNRLGSVATIERVAQLLDQISGLGFGLGVAVFEPCPLALSDVGLEQATQELVVRLLETLRDPMTVVSRLHDAVAFAVPGSDLALFENQIHRLRDRMRSQSGGTDLWQFEVVCATPPYSAHKVFELLHEQASIALGGEHSKPHLAA